MILDDEFELKGIAEDIAKGGAHSLARRIVAAVEKAASPAKTATRLDSKTVRARLAAATDSSPPDLSKTDLSGLDLNGVDFERANLTDCPAGGDRAGRSDLFTVDLTDAVLANADLSRANLDGTVLRRADFQAHLEGPASSLRSSSRPIWPTPIFPAPGSSATSGEPSWEAPVCATPMPAPIQAISLWGSCEPPS